MSQTESRQLPANAFESLFEVCIDLMGIATFEGWFVKLNPAWERVLGYSREELMAAPFLSFVHPDDQEATIAEAQKLTEGAVVLMFRNRYRCKDGSYKWIDWTSTPHAGHNYFTAREATERMKLEEELRTSLEQVRKSNETLRALSTPILKVAPGVLLLPVIGRIDAERTTSMMEMLLQAIVQSASTVTILDLTGVAEVDAESASHVLSIVHAAGLLGSECLVSGIRAQIATTLVELGVSTENMRTFGTLSAALAHALKDRITVQKSGGTSTPMSQRR
jgi:rsbT co-antagonist protein RsbR